MRINDASAEVHNARERFKACPELKRFIWAYLDNEVEHQRRTSIQAAFELARNKSWTSSDGDPFKVNNNLSAAVARLYLKERPWARKYIKTRKAACDGMEEFE